MRNRLVPYTISYGNEVEVVSNESPVTTKYVRASQPMLDETDGAHHVCMSIAICMVSNDLESRGQLAFLLCFQCRTAEYNSHHNEELKRSINEAVMCDVDDTWSLPRS